MRTVSKGRIFGIVTEISDELLARLAASPQILQNANAAGARAWHSGILPEHFKKSAHAKYGYANRSRNYLKIKRGLPDLLSPQRSGHSGSMKQQMTSMRQIVATATGAKLILRANTLNFCPNIADNNQDSYVKQRGRKGPGRPYPNLKREVKVVLDVERQAIAEVVAKSLQEQMQPQSVPRGLQFS